MESDNYFSKYYYSDWIMMAVTLVAFLVGIKRGYRDKELRLIFFYSLASLIQDCIAIYFEVIAEKNIESQRILIVSLNLFLLIELSIFYLYLYQNITGLLAKAFMKVIYVAFIAFVLFNWIKLPILFFSYLPPIFALESFCIIIPCLVYFHEIFKIQKHVALRNEPSFWIITGLLFYHTSTIPLNVLTNYIKVNLSAYSDALASLNFILYTLLFILVIKAFKCKKRVII